MFASVTQAPLGLPEHVLIMILSLVRDEAPATANADAKWSYAGLMAGTGSVSKLWRCVVKSFLMGDRLAWLTVKSGAAAQCLSSFPHIRSLRIDTSDDDPGTDLVLRTGALAVLHGLRLRTDLNGQRATLLAYRGWDSRWEVRMNDTAEVVHVKPANLAVDLSRHTPRARPPAARAPCALMCALGSPPRPHACLAAILLQAVPTQQLACCVAMPDFELVYPQETGPGERLRRDVGVESRRSHPSKWHFRSEYGICAL
jgi:hypothetical protein